VNDRKKEIEKREASSTFAAYVWCPVCTAPHIKGTECPECKTVTTEGVASE
jgi:hypothetical protein